MFVEGGGGGGGPLHLFQGGGKARKRVTLPRWGGEKKKEPIVVLGKGRLKRQSTAQKPELSEKRKLEFKTVAREAVAKKKRKDLLQSITSWLGGEKEETSGEQEKKGLYHSGRKKGK